MEYDNNTDGYGMFVIGHKGKPFTRIWAPKQDFLQILDKSLDTHNEYYRLLDPSHVDFLFQDLKWEEDV